MIRTDAERNLVAQHDPVAFQAITTRYRGPSNARGSRVLAKCAGGSKSVGWEDELGSEQNHHAAARALANKMGWSGDLIPAGMPDGSYVHVFVPRSYADAVLAVCEARYAMRQGENNGNPHAKAWGQAITALTDPVGDYEVQFSETYRKFEQTKSTATQ
ncbi:hypothetical protein IB275_30320 [Pseudomonas sp. PDM21]|uniref:hypothetical protein n=1 Tax=Pseudomonas sp. PDM21 TaxID=2769257 RepID=UPI0017822C62|nr:hypothetical protein [Pseudomonas sp. PDM21]MBD9674911.1 hypothetical protein [Pseudomonas sp. PDM21]